MNSIQLIWNRTKKTLKFVWRHFFTLICLFTAIHAFIFTDPIFSRVLFTLGIAVAIDWAKQFIKPNRNFDPHSKIGSHDISAPLHIRQWSNPGIMGTGAYDLNRRGMKWDK